MLRVYNCTFYNTNVNIQIRACDLINGHFEIKNASSVVDKSTSVSLKHYVHVVLLYTERVRSPDRLKAVSNHRRSWNIFLLYLLSICLYGANEPRHKLCHINWFV